MKFPKKPKNRKGFIWIRVIDVYPNGDEFKHWESLPKVKYRNVSSKGKILKGE